MPNTKSFLSDLHALPEYKLLFRILALYFIKWQKEMSDKTAGDGSLHLHWLERHHPLVWIQIDLMINLGKHD